MPFDTRTKLKITSVRANAPSKIPSPGNATEPKISFLEDAWYC